MSIWLKRLAKLALGIVVCAIAVLPFFLPAPATVPNEADAIVVLGGGTGDRVAKSLQLLEAGYAAKLVLTGATPSPDGSKDVVDARAEFLIRNQVSPAQIFYVFPSSNTWQEAGSTLEFMGRMGWKKVIVVSDPPHMLRLSYTWSKVFQGHSQQYILVATEPAWWNPSLWWSSQNSLLFVASELVKLGYYILRY